MSNLYQERIAECERCPELQSFSFVLMCSKCGCFIEPKARLSKGTCPLGKWADREITDTMII